MVPMPRFSDWDAFNDFLEEQCLKRQGDILRGHKVSIGERLEADLAVMQALPAAPLQGWALPDAFIAIQRLLEARQGKTGKRKYVQVLRLLERFEMEALHGAIKDALHMGAISFPSHGLQGQTTAGQRTP